MNGAQQVADDARGFGQCRFFKGRKFAACVSQALVSGSPLATDGQFT
jgi:hypothetical protein